MTEDVDKSPAPTQELLTDDELKEVVGGMQNQLNNDPTTGHPGGANNKVNLNPAKVQILCNGLAKKG